MNKTVTNGESLKTSKRHNARNVFMGLCPLLLSFLLSDAWAQNLGTNLDNPQLIDSISRSPEREKISLKADFSLEGDQVSGTMNEASVFGVKTGMDFQHQTAENLSIHAKGGFKLEEGSSETIFPDGAGASFKPKSSLYLEHAEVQYAPFEWAKLTGGAINQEYHQNSLFITETPFVGAKESLLYEIEGWELGLHLLQSIPSNHTLSQRLGEVQQGSARFYSERIQASKSTMAYEVDLGLGHFAYDQLSPSIAYNSRLLGNTVTGFGSENNRFVYNYMGWNGDAKFLYKGLGKNIFGAYGGYHVNTSAPADRNLGFNLGTQYTYLLSNGTLNFFAETFENQSDSTVAYYSDKNYGFVNREGLKAKVNFQNIRDDYEIEAQAVRSSPIRENSLQDEETIFSLSLRKSYDIL